MAYLFVQFGYGADSRVRGWFTYAGIRSNSIDPRSVRGLVRRSAKPELATSTALSKLLQTAASSDPLVRTHTHALIRYSLEAGIDDVLDRSPVH
jgi:hypothetical protein